MVEAGDTGRARKVLMGTCGWSDPTLLRCGKFYPASVRSAEDRLRHYSSHFPCVEVDTSTYAIPSPVSISRWIGAVNPGFLFHFKAFGLFCSKSGSITTIPGKIRSKLPPTEDQHVRLYDLPSAIRDELWGVFNSVLQPVHKAGCLGVVIFQFHLSFKPSEENQHHVLWCRRNLDSRYSMAVEFRCRDWFVGDQKIKTESWLTSKGLALISADELEHETFQKDREQTGLAPGQLRVVLPVAWSFPQLHFHYIRVHRREGNQRLLSEQELDTWALRLGSQVPHNLKGPIYFMWGTDWEDQPLMNAKRLTERLPQELVFDWKAALRTKNRLQSMFGAVSSKIRACPQPFVSSEDTTHAPSTNKEDHKSKSPVHAPGPACNVEGVLVDGSSVEGTTDDSRSSPHPMSSPSSLASPQNQKPSQLEAIDHETAKVSDTHADTDVNETCRKRAAISLLEAAQDSSKALAVNSVPSTFKDLPPSKRKPTASIPLKKPKPITAATTTTTITSFFKRASRE